jgi:type VI secretion system protein ImpF
MQQSLKRDLENLLNTRVRCTGWPEEYVELERSLVAYGIPDVTAADLQTQRGRREFLRRVEAVIRAFEPRFKSVRVRPVENADYVDRTLRFRVDAMMYAYPAPEPVVFDSALEPISGGFSVKDAHP